MAYNTIVQIASSPSLLNRAAAAAAEQGLSDPVGWAQRHAWELAAEPGWADAWESAEAALTLDQNPDTGVRPSVITDAMILAAVQAIIAAETPEPPPEE
jgi:hypothetical protein